MINTMSCVYCGAPSYLIVRNREHSQCRKCGRGWADARAPWLRSVRLDAKGIGSATVTRFWR